MTVIQPPTVGVLQDFNQSIYPKLGPGVATPWPDMAETRFFIQVHTNEPCHRAQFTQEPKTV